MHLLFILDEATASVAPESERELRQAISELTKNKALLMIAHRLNTVYGEQIKFLFLKMHRLCKEKNIRS